MSIPYVGVAICRACLAAGQFAGRFNQIDTTTLLGSDASIAAGNYQVDVKQCLIDGDIDSLDAFLIHPSGLVSPIQESIEVVKQFNVIRREVRLLVRVTHHILVPFKSESDKGGSRVLFRRDQDDRRGK